MQTICTYRTHLEASFAVSLLQSEGFAAALLDEESFLYGASAGSIRLQVPSVQAAEAVDFLRAFREAESSTDDESEAKL